MSHIRPQYIVLGIIMGFILLLAFLTTLPDGKLHIVFCNVGQGDATYIRFPDGRDMLIDGGPTPTGVLSCLGQFMPFWDRTLDFVLLTHAEKDHYGGLPEVVKRYRVRYFGKSESENSGPEYRAFLEALSTSPAQVKNFFAGDQMTVGFVLCSLLWPSHTYIAQHAMPSASTTNVLAAHSGSQNERSLVMHLRYGTFDALLTGDADSQVEDQYLFRSFGNDPIEALKVPHHGSKTGMNDQFLNQVQPQLAVISVGANNPYHHPSSDTLSLLSKHGVQIARTDQNGWVSIVSDGKIWSMKTER